MSPEQVAQINGAEICWQGFGDSSDPPILLAHGGGDSMLAWREGFCERLADGGRYVVRYDVRDAGRSTTYEPGDPQYSESDLLADVVALVESIGMGPVHFVGLSGGTATGQQLALEHPETLATLTLMAGTPGFPSETGDLPGPHPSVARVFSGAIPDPDWTDRDAVVEYLVELERPFAGSGGYDAEAQAEYAGRVFDRTRNLEAQLTNPFAVEGGEGWRERLGEIKAPTLVIQGADDPLFPLPHGEALATEIPNAELLVLEGVGHEYPPPRVWDEVAGAILAHTAVE